MAIFHRIAGKLGTERTLRWLRFYPPYFGASVRIVEMNLAEGMIEVGMPLHFMNQNAFGTHFGGSLYAMCDPWFVFILMHQLGKEYVIWDKSARIDFKQPGRGLVKARFHISETRLAEIQAKLQADGRAWPEFDVDVLSPEGEVVASVHKVISIRQKQRR